YVYGYGDAKAEPINTIDAVQVIDNYVMMDYPYTLVDDYYEEKFVSFDQVYTKRVFRQNIMSGINEIQHEYELLDDGFNFAVTEDGPDKFDMSSSVKVLPVVPGQFLPDLTTENVPTNPPRRWDVPALIDVDRTQRPSDFYLAFYQ